MKTLLCFLVGAALAAALWHRHWLMAHPGYTIAVILCVCWLSGLFWYLWGCRNAPAGYEDAKGWHEGREP